MRFKVLLPAALVVAVAMVLAAGHRGANATTLAVSAQGLGAASAAEAAFLAGLSGATTDSFEGFTPANPALSFVTSVGTFTQTVAGSGGSCGTCIGLVILDAVTTPFKGRFAVGGSNWLDSNDSKEMTWVPTFSYPTRLGFYITDPNDSDGRMDITAVDGSTMSTSFVNIFGTGANDLPSGAVFYLSVFDPDGIASLKFFSNEAADGYGIDRRVSQRNARRIAADEIDSGRFRGTYPADLVPADPKHLT